MIVRAEPPSLQDMDLATRVAPLLAGVAVISIVSRIAALGAAGIGASLVALFLALALAGRWGRG